MAEVRVAFRGIDDWGRPVFKDLESETYYGSVDILPDSEEELNAIVESDLLYFGKHFNCEPYGSKTKNKLVIVRN